MEPRDDESLKGLPKQVRDLAEQSRRIKEEILRQQQQPEDGTPDESQVIEPEAVVEEAPVAAEPREAESQATPSPEAEEWKRKHDALYGRYANEIGQARKAIKDLESEVAALTDRLKAAEAKPVESAKDPEPGLDPKQFEDYDDAIKQLATTVSRLEAESLAKDQTIVELRQQVDNRLAPIAKQVAQSEYDAFLAALTGQVERLGEVNSDPDFVAWLGAPNPYDPNGGSLGDTLRAAEARRDVGSCARIFKDFVTQSDKYKPAPTAQTAAPRPKNVQPGASQAPTAAPDKGKRMWTAREVEAFYADLAKGKYVGRAEEERAIRAEIFQAHRENRIA